MNGRGDPGGATVVGDALRVLVAGDSPRIDATADALAAELVPAAVVRARTLEGARERLDREDVHCALCEFPGETGRELLESTADGVPIVAVTDDGAVERALEAGATDVVSPDASAEVLAARVGHIAECRRRAERAADRCHRALVESADAPIWLLEPDGTVTYASTAVEDRFGYAPGELERTPLERLIHPDDRSILRKALERIANGPFGATDRLAVRIGSVDGEWRVATLTLANRLEDPALGGIVATAALPGATAPSDVRDAIDRLEEPLFAVGPDWELRWANAAAGRLFADDPEPGRVVWDVLRGELREEFGRELREAVASASSVRFEATVSDEDGTTTFTVSAAPNREGDAAANGGLTVLAREQHDGGGESNRLAVLESAVDALEDGIAVVDDGTIELANRSLADRYGEADLVGREVARLFDDDLAAAVHERAQSSIVRWMEPVRGELAVDDGVPVDVYVAPLRAPGRERTRALCVVRDRRRSAAGALSAVRRALTAIGRAETAGSVRRTVLETLLERTEADLAVWYRADEDRYSPAAVETAGPSPSLEPPIIDGDRLSDDTAALFEDRPGPAAVDRDELGDFLAAAGIDAERALVVPVGDAGVALATSPEPLAFESLDRDRDREAVEAIADGAAIALAGFARESSLRTCRRDRSRLERELTLEADARDLARSLLEARSREAVERRLCEGLVELGDGSRRETDGAGGTTAVVWVGGVDAGSGTVTPRARAGRDVADLLDGLELPVDREAPDPTGRTAARREATVVDDLEAAPTGTDADAATDPDDSNGERRRAREAGFRSALSVPLSHDRDEFRYGTVTAYAERSGAFGDRLRRIVGFLARVAAYAIGSLERERALLADGVVELEVVFRDDSEPFAAFVRRVGQQVGRRVDVRAVVPRSSGGATVYCAIAPADDAAATGAGNGNENTATENDPLQLAADSVSDLESVELVGGDAGDAGSQLVELEFAGTTVAERIAAHGGVLCSARAVDDRVRLVIELSRSLEVRPFLDALERAYPGTELLARRERDRAARPTRPFEAELRDRLSERQLRTLESAYYGGFFAWPRESTGEEVAESLGVSQPTFSRHLRLAEGKLFELLFDERFSAPE
ncbi:histidine kinase [Halobiforma lacisalsi AJ5]|uniref:Histidine kinase n=1 Tax=Natronobacterium lacisalsi AJ5 TaxID=358396 RepID=M0LB85_NATLA|nr:bacterio-opsin activator domain-containing protein [Halobiforma lacisalsi]APW99256.1 histidine kinase [Halobiforma lacisalsi AJ5]EMA30827.1 PAS/PAC sensor protein [Halobiforma lacisalsi AJ5]